MATASKRCLFTETSSPSCPPSAPSPPFARPRHDHRLYSTVKCTQLEPSKFHRVLSPRRVSWNKWRLNSFPVVSEQFRRQLKEKLERMSGEGERGEREVKLRHKIREVMKLREDIEKARENNRLIKLIEDSHEQKINRFFD